jgi:hypothetical protein
MTSTKMGLAMSAVLALLGCKETTSSCNIRTAGLAMLTEVTASSESSVRVKTTLLVGGDESNTYAILDSCDELYAEADGARKQMSAIDDGIYEAKFDKGAEDTEYRVVLKRDQDDTADGNSGTLPAPFDVTSDLGPDPISRADDEIEVTWDPAGSSDDMRLAIDDKAAGCIFDKDINVPGDSGSYVIGKGELESTSDQDPETCDVTGALSRKRDGSTDRTLDSESYFHLTQVRSFKFTSAP